MADKLPKQLQKRATNPQTAPNGLGIKLVGVDPGYDTTQPTFSTVVAAGGNQVTLTLSSDNADLFEFIRVNIKDQKGHTASGAYAGGAIVINTTSISKTYSTNKPDIRIQVVYKLKEGVQLGGVSPTLDYALDFDAATFAAGLTYDNLDRLNTNDNGMYIEISAVYDASGTPDITTIDITAVAAIGMEFDVLKNGTSVGTITVGSDGTGQLVANGTLASGTYVFRAICTTAGAGLNSFAEDTVVVP